MPARKEIKLKKMTQEVVSKMITKCIQSKLKRLKDFHKWSPHIWTEKINEIQDECQQLNKFISGSNSIELQNVICFILDKTFRLLQTFCRTRHLNVLDGAKYFDIRQTCLSILGSVFLPCIQQLDLRTCDDFSLGLAIENLGLICNIKKLTLISDVASLTLSLQEKIGVLTKLQELHCIECCTNQILTTVAGFCQELILLDVRSSKQVDDSSLHNIIRLSSLRTLILTNTSISDRGYRKIMLSLPELRNVCWKRPVDELIRDLPFQISSKFVCAGLKMVAPAILVMKCPHISTLCITSQGENVDISTLSGLKQLTNFEIKNFDFVANEINRFLHQSGRILKSLLLDGCRHVHCGNIVNNCHNLKSLKLMRCEFMKTSSVDMEQASPHFKSLRELHLSLNVDGTELYEHIQFYQNLQELHVTDTAEVDDDFIKNLVEKNVFMGLVIFLSVLCPLTYSTADFLIENCENLKKLGDLDFWDISNDDIHEINAKAYRLNLDIQFVCIQSITSEEQ